MRKHNTTVLTPTRYELVIECKAGLGDLNKLIHCFTTIIAIEPLESSNRGYQHIQITYVLERLEQQEQLLSKLRKVCGIIKKPS